MALPFTEIWDMGNVMVNFLCVTLARLRHLAVWSNTHVDVAVKIFFICD